MNAIWITLLSDDRGRNNNCPQIPAGCEPWEGRQRRVQGLCQGAMTRSGDSMCQEKLWSLPSPENCQSVKRLHALIRSSPSQGTCWEIPWTSPCPAPDPYSGLGTALLSLGPLVWLKGMWLDANVLVLTLCSFLPSLVSSPLPLPPDLSLCKK